MRRQPEGAEDCGVGVGVAERERGGESVLLVAAVVTGYCGGNQRDPTPAPPPRLLYRRLCFLHQRAWNDQRYDTRVFREGHGMNGAIEGTPWACAETWWGRWGRGDDVSFDPKQGQERDRY